MASNEFAGKSVNRTKARKLRIINLGIKRFFDILISLLGLVILSPLLLVLALVVRSSSPGPALFRQERLGKNGEVFRIAKFRTMVLDAEHIGPGLQLSSSDDPRITKVGRVMRATRLDELPQLLNVLVGEMSLVGPRPPATYWPYDGFANYPEWAKKRFTMRPGMTGLVQVSHEVSFSPWDDRIVVDNEYVDNFTVFLDIRILLLTVKTVFKHEAI